jgi:hypothetical protein
VKLARQRGNTHVLDFMFRSPLTTTDSNYWDHKHYIVAVGDQISELIAEAVTSAQPGEDYRILHSAAPDRL